MYVLYFFHREKSTIQILLQPLEYNIYSMIPPGGFLMVDFGMTLRTLRRKEDMTQAELARKLDVVNSPRRWGH